MSKHVQTPGGENRITVYLNNELLRTLEARARKERNSRSGLVTSVMGFLLLSPVGERLQATADQNQRSLAQQLENTLVIFRQPATEEAIDELAKASQKTSDQIISELLNTLLSVPIKQKLQEHAKRNQRTFVQELAEILDQLLVSKLGQKLQESAEQNQRSLTQELSRNLIGFREEIPVEQIEKLAQVTQRITDEMLIHLMLIGLRVYLE